MYVRFHHILDLLCLKCSFTLVSSSQSKIHCLNIDPELPLIIFRYITPGIEAPLSFALKTRPLFLLLVLTGTQNFVCLSCSETAVKYFSMLFMMSVRGFHKIACLCKKTSQISFFMVSGQTFLILCLFLCLFQHL